MRVRNNEKILRGNEGLRATNAEVLARNDRRLARHLGLFDIECTSKCFNVECGLRFGSNEQLQFVSVRERGHPGSVVEARHKRKLRTHFTHSTQRVIRLSGRRSLSRDIVNVDIEETTSIVIQLEQRTHEQEFIHVVRIGGSGHHLSDIRRQATFAQECLLKNRLINRK